MTMTSEKKRQLTSAEKVMGKNQVLLKKLADTPVQRKFTSQMGLAEKIMDDDREVLKGLADNRFAND